MKTEIPTTFLLAALLSTTALVGCAKHAAVTPPPLDPAVVSATVNHAFETAPDDTKQQATSYVSALQGQDAPTAFNQLQQLRAQKNLNPEQRAAVAQAMRTTFQQLQASAQNGNTAAQAAMHKYLSSR